MARHQITQQRLLWVLSIGFGLVIVLLLAAAFVGVTNVQSIRSSVAALVQEQSATGRLIVEIEREQANPTLAVTFRISRAFGMTVGDLVEMPGATSSVQVIRANDRAQTFRSDKNCTIRTLSPLNLEKDVEFYEVKLHAGGALRSQPHFEGTREFLVIEQGKVRVESGEDTDELEEGDSATYRADVRHAIVNIGKGEALVFLVDIYR